MFYFVNDRPPAWVAMESQNITVPLHLYMYSVDKKKLLKNTKNPFFEKYDKDLADAIDYWGMTKKFLSYVS